MAELFTAGESSKMIGRTGDTAYKFLYDVRYSADVVYTVESQFKYNDQFFFLDYEKWMYHLCISNFKRCRVLYNGLDRR